MTENNFEIEIRSALLNSTLRHIKNMAPLITVSENDGRRGGYYGGEDGDTRGYRAVLVYIQKGLGGYKKLFKQVTKLILLAQSNGGFRYPLIPMSFGEGASLKSENKYFDLGYANDSLNVSRIADTFSRICGVEKSGVPAIVPDLFPKTDIRNLYTGKTDVHRDDLIIFIGRKHEVFFSPTLELKLNRMKKQILFVEIEGETINITFGKSLPIYYEQLKTNIMKSNFIIHKLSNSINSVDEWFQYAPPKRREEHWVDGKSAKELAKAWFDNDGGISIPNELTQILDSNSVTSGTVLREGIPEHKIRLDEFKIGETRNADLVLVGELNKNPIVVNIEAKGSESFGVLIEDQIQNGGKKNSNILPRLELLCEGIFGNKNYSDYKTLRYQLLHGSAASLIEAKNRNAKIALFIVHEFLSLKLNEKASEKNQKDLENFIHTFKGYEYVDVKPGKLIGPISVPGGKYIPSNIPLYIGKISRTLKI